MTFPLLVLQGKADDVTAGVVELQQALEGNSTALTVKVPAIRRQVNRV